MSYRDLPPTAILQLLDRMSRDQRETFLIRRYLLGCKRKWSTARGLIHYRRLLDAYLKAKRARCPTCGDWTCSAYHAELRPRQNWIDEIFNAPDDSPSTIP